MGNAVSNLNSGIYDAADAVNTFAYKYTTTWVRYTNNVTPLEVSPLVGYSHKFLLGKTVVAVGPLNNSNYTIAIPNNSWTLVANPYSSAVDLGANYVTSIANWMPTGSVDPNIWVPTHGATAGSPLQFATYNLSTGLAQNGGSKFVAPQQAFWVKNPKAIAGTFAMYKTARVHDTTVKLKSSTGDADDVLRLTVENSYAKDEVVFAFRSVGSDVVTTSDSEKRLATDAKVANIYSLKEGKALAINCKPEINQATTIPLGVSVGATGAGLVKIVATNITGFLPTYHVVLEDLSTSQLYDLRVLPYVELTLAAGTVNNRLVLHLNPIANPINPAPSLIGGGVTTGDILGLGESNQTITISSTNNKARVEIISKESIDATIELFTATGESNGTLTTTSRITDITLPDVTQIYIVRVTSGDMVKSSKVIK